MLDLDGVRQAHQRDMAEVINRLKLASENEWLAQTPCAEWTVADLAAHLAAGQAFKADALQRMKSGVTDVGPVPTVSDDRSTLLNQLRENNARLEAELEGLSAHDLDKPVPLPFGAFPLEAVLQIFVMEAGVHAQDVQMAMTGRGILPPDVIDATAAILPAVFDPGEQPTGPVSYRLLAPSHVFHFTWRDGQWVDEASDDACCIEGDDNTLLLFALGRIPVDDPGLYVTDLEVARRFKAYFPGP
jgi:uncharacterized protein (TIGR03083 family)